MLYLLQDHEILINQRYKLSATKFFKKLFYFVVKIILQSFENGQNLTKTQFLPSHNKDLTRVLRKKKIIRIVAFYLSYSDSTQNSKLIRCIVCYICKYTEIAAIVPYQGPRSLNLVVLASTLILSLSWGWVACMYVCRGGKGSKITLNRKMKGTNKFLTKLTKYIIGITTLRYNENFHQNFIIMPVRCHNYAKIV